LATLFGATDGVHEAAVAPDPTPKAVSPTKAATWADVDRAAVDWVVEGDALPDVWGDTDRVEIRLDPGDVRRPETTPADGVAHASELYRLGHYAEAIALLDERSWPGAAEVVVDCQLKLMDLAGAEGTLGRLEGEAAGVRLAELALESGRFDEALRRAEALDTPRALRVAARAMLELGFAADARARLEPLIAALPEEAPLRVDAEIDHVVASLNAIDGAGIATATGLVARLRAQLGDGHPETLRAASLVAPMLRSERDAAREALALVDHLVAVADRLPWHPMRAWLAVHRGNALLHLGRAAEAIAALDQAEAEWGRLVAADHPTMLSVKSERATALVELGRVGEAAALGHQVLEDRARVLGPFHPSTLITRNSLLLGSAATTLADWQALFRDTRTHLGDGHLLTLTAACNLAITQGEQGDPGGGADTLEAIVAGAIDGLGEGQTSVVQALASIGSCRAQEGRWEAAVPWLVRALASQTGTLGVDHPDAQHTRTWLTLSHWQAGEHEQAVSVARAQVASWRRVPTTAWQLLEPANRVFRFDWVRGRHTEAREEVLTVLALLESRALSDAERFAVCGDLLATLHEFDAVAARPWVDAAIRWGVEVHGEGSEVVADLRAARRQLG
jgi:tetratricopeptide (TPR) repeat protein